MPIYEFRCGECGGKFSEIRRMGEDLGGPCPHCQSLNTKKMISTFASITSRSADACPSASGCSSAGSG
ncbi:MAG: hypothetical protein A2176_10550 [Spirochaetes bacterium RBG_13_51_14]|nr:MAG: hypothetical protein A2176_10550 [Spirochaetes bacterium RBG_13_51_14]